MYRLLRSLEELSDQYKYFVEKFSKRKIKADQEILELIKEININFDKFYQIFYKYNPETLEELFISCKNIFIKIDDLFKTDINKEQLHFALILNEKIKILLSSVIEYSANQN